MFTGEHFNFTLWDQILFYFFFIIIDLLYKECSHILNGFVKIYIHTNLRILFSNTLSLIAPLLNDDIAS